MSLAKHQRVLEKVNSMCKIIIIHCGKQDTARPPENNGMRTEEKMQDLESENIGSSSDVSRALSLPLPADVLPH